MRLKFMRRPGLAVVLVLAALSAAACLGGTASQAEPTPRVDPFDALDGSPPGFPDLVPPEEPLEAPRGVPEEIQTVWEVWAILTDEHVDRSKMDPDVFSEAAIRGMLEALGDPHTNYVGPEAFQIDRQDLQGQFEGIGANVSMTRDGKLVVVAPIAGGPADRAGVRPGDVILEVDGEPVDDLSLLGAVALIRGPKGSTVDLLIRHIGAIDPSVIKVTRGVIPLESVVLRSEPGAEVAHIRLTNFYADTPEILAEMIDEAVESGAEALILDVRDNPGGLLSSVIDITSMFLDDGLVLYEVDGEGQRRNHMVRRNGEVEDIPMVMLANEFSASASEILVGALQDHDRADMIGATTFGKGSVNILRELGNGGGLSVTVSRWYTPAGRLIQGNGLEPNIEVTSRDPQRADVMQLEKAMEYIEALRHAKASGI